MVPAGSKAPFKAIIIRQCFNNESASHGYLAFRFHFNWIWILISYASSKANYDCKYEAWVKPTQAILTERKSFLLILWRPAQAHVYQFDLDLELARVSSD